MEVSFFILLQIKYRCFTYNIHQDSTIISTLNIEFCTAMKYNNKRQSKTNFRQGD